MTETDIMIENYSIVANNYTIREETFEGRIHIVVPVVMMREGVHAGSAGPMLHQGEQLAQFVESWNGIPVTISHPTDGETNVIANSPRVLEQDSVGRIFNAHYDDGLKAEAWIDVVRIAARSPVALAAIKEGRPLDVSVGVFNDTEIAEEGAQWNGETYEAIASNYRPDHLALLPGERGACSWDDGCGIRANKEGGTMPKMDLLKTIKELSLQGYAVLPVTNEQGFRETTSLLQAKLDALDTSERVYYLQEVYNDHFIYEVRDRELGGTTLYKRNYTVNANEVTIGETPVEVQRKVEYVTMKDGRPTSNNQTKGGQKMSESKTLCCEAKVDALIANKATHWKAEDKEWLLTQEASVIEKMSPVAEEKPAEASTGVQANAEETITTFKGTLKAVEDYTGLMPEAMKAQVEGGVKLYKEHREELVKGILANTTEVWEEATLNAMDDKTLESVSKSVNKPADYSGLGNPASNSGGEKEEKLLPIGVSANQKKEE